MGGLFIYKKLLILLLTLVFIFSLSSVSADDGVNVSPDENNSQELSVDNELYDTIDEFVEGEPYEFSEELFDIKKVELKVKSDIYTGRRIYIHNGRFKKVKEDE